jgi:hypothetical protein
MQDLFETKTVQTKYQDIIEDAIKSTVSRYLAHAILFSIEESNLVCTLSFFNSMYSIAIPRSEAGRFSVNINQDTSHQRGYRSTQTRDKFSYALMKTGITEKLRETVEMSLKGRFQRRAISLETLTYPDTRKFISKRLSDAFDDLIFQKLTSEVTGKQQQDNFKTDKYIYELIWATINRPEWRDIYEAQFDDDEFIIDILNLLQAYSLESTAILADKPALWGIWRSYVHSLQHNHISSYTLFGYQEGHWETAIYDFLSGYGLTKQAWKWCLTSPLLKQFNKGFSPMVNHYNTTGYRDLRQWCFVINVICQIVTDPNVNTETVEYLYEVITKSEHDYTILAKRILKPDHIRLFFYRAVWRAIKQYPQVEDCPIKGEIDNCVDYVKAMEGLWDQKPSKRLNDIDWWLAKSDEWHEFVQVANNANNHQWKSLIAATEISGYQIVPLLSSKDMFEEGKQMGNCLASLDKQCLSGQRRFFSIRLPSEKRPIATFDITMNNHKWMFSQMELPFSNKRVPDHLRQLAEQVLALYQKQYDKWISELMDNSTGTTTAI